MVIMLLQAGAKLLLKDSRGRQAIQEAQLFHPDSAIVLLLQNVMKATEEKEKMDEGQQEEEKK